MLFLGARIECVDGGMSQGVKSGHEVGVTSALGVGIVDDRGGR